MQITVLLDNNTLIDRYFQAEPGFSLYVKDDGVKVLFDCGFSDVACRNAGAMGIDLLDLDYIVLSHGHLDHSWGLTAIARLMTAAQLSRRPFKRPRLVTHPLALAGRCDEELSVAGSIMSQYALKSLFTIATTAEPQWLTRRLVFLGEIERDPAGVPHGPHGALVDARDSGMLLQDQLVDDTALAYQSDDGVVIITGCSHSGICNTVRQAKRVCERDRVVDIIGGFHLLNASDEHLQSVVHGLREHNVGRMHPCHCTDLRSKIALAQHFQVHEVGVGVMLDYQ